MFHVSTFEFPKGTVVAPGHWGRKIRACSVPSLLDQKAVGLWELALEAVRMTANPSLPSRLDCIFLTETKEAAIQFRDRFRPDGRIFEVAVWGSESNTRRCDFDLISTPVPENRAIETMAERARQYWCDDPRGMIEVLYAGHIQIVRMV